MVLLTEERRLKRAALVYAMNLHNGLTQENGALRIGQGRRWKSADRLPNLDFFTRRCGRLGVEAVEPGGVAARDLELVLGAGILEVARDDLLRVRPGRGLVRIVG